MQDIKVLRSQIETCVSCPESFRHSYQDILSNIKKSSEVFIEYFLTTTHESITSSHSPPVSKFYILFLLLKATELKNYSFMHFLAKATDLLEYLFKCAQFDSSPEIPTHNKGMHFFSKFSSQTEMFTGTNFVRICQELFVTWNEMAKDLKPRKTFSIFCYLHKQLNKKISFPKAYNFLNKNFDMKQDISTNNFQQNQPYLLVIPATQNSRKNTRPSTIADLRMEQYQDDLSICSGREDRYVFEGHTQPISKFSQRKQLSDNKKESYQSKQKNSINNVCDLNTMVDKNCLSCSFLSKINSPVKKELLVTESNTPSSFVSSKLGSSPKLLMSPESMKKFEAGGRKIVLDSAYMRSSTKSVGSSAEDGENSANTCKSSTESINGADYGSRRSSDVESTVTSPQESVDSSKYGSAQKSLLQKKRLAGIISRPSRFKMEAQTIPVSNDPLSQSLILQLQSPANSYMRNPSVRTLSLNRSPKPKDLSSDLLEIQNSIQKSLVFSRVSSPVSHMIQRGQSSSQLDEGFSGKTISAMSPYRLNASAVTMKHQESEIQTITNFPEAVGDIDKKKYQAYYVGNNYNERNSSCQKLSFSDCNQSQKHQNSLTGAARELNFTIPSIQLDISIEEDTIEQTAQIYEDSNGKIERTPDQMCNTRLLNFAKTHTFSQSTSYLASKKVGKSNIDSENIQRKNVKEVSRFDKNKNETDELKLPSKQVNKYIDCNSKECKSNNCKMEKAQLKEQLKEYEQKIQELEGKIRLGLQTEQRPIRKSTLRLAKVKLVG